MTDPTPRNDPFTNLPIEMLLAGKVQSLLFPKSPPVCSWCCIEFENRMSAVLGGDFFDFIPLEDGCQALLIGDVTGHSVHASIVMSLAYGYLHRAVKSACEPLATVADLNHFLRSFAKRSARYDHFFSATLFFGVINPETLTMRYVSAGHPAGLVRRGRSLIRLSTTGHPLGYFDHPELAEEVFTFARGDRMLLYTDGLVDCLSPAGEVFGASGLEKFIMRQNGDHKEFLTALFKTFQEHLGGQSAVDDCTAILVDLHKPGGIT